MQHEVPEMEMIIIKRGHPHEEHPHGGAWKVAFADFMTAMMAFFLVLWIVNSTNKETRSSVARYFNPIRISDTTAARKGLEGSARGRFRCFGRKRRKDAEIADARSHRNPKGRPDRCPATAGRMRTRVRKARRLGSMDPITARDPFIVLDELAGRATGASAAEGRAASAEFDMMYDGPTPYRDPFAPPRLRCCRLKPSLRRGLSPRRRRRRSRCARAARPSSQAEVAANERAIADANSVAERLREETEKARGR